MYTVTLTALVLIAGADPEPVGKDATKIAARATWPYVKVDIDKVGKDQQQLVLKSAADLVAAVPLYANRDALPAVVEKEATAALAKALKVKDIDWKTQMVIVVTGGSQSSGGYRMEVTELKIKDKTMTVNWKLHAPKGFATNAFTHPSQVVLVPRFAGKVAFAPAKGK